jgi:hypothetical protein
MQSGKDLSQRARERARGRIARCRALNELIRVIVCRVSVEPYLLESLFIAKPKTVFGKPAGAVRPRLGFYQRRRRTLLSKKRTHF